MDCASLWQGRKVLALDSGMHGVRDKGHATLSHIQSPFWCKPIKTNAHPLRISQETHHNGSWAQRRGNDLGPW